jgi:hypothetical protein
MSNPRIAEIRERLEKAETPLPEVDGNLSSIHFGGPSPMQRSIKARQQAEEDRKRTLEAMPADIRFLLGELETILHPITQADTWKALKDAGLHIDLVKVQEEKITQLEAESKFNAEVAIGYGKNIERLEAELCEAKAENETHRWRLIGAQVDPTPEAYNKIASRLELYKIALNKWRESFYCDGETTEKAIAKANAFNEFVAMAEVLKDSEGG